MELSGFLSVVSGEDPHVFVCVDVSELCDRVTGGSMFKA
jgi:hypothetical protein